MIDQQTIHLSLDRRQHNPQVEAQMNPPRTLSHARAMRYTLATTIGFALAISAAYAQTTTTTPAQPQIEVIKVTAEKRSADVLKTPIPITVLTGQTLLREGKHRIDEILQDVPGVAVYDDGGGAFRVLIRGLTNSTDPNSDQADPTSTYFDGVYYDLSAQQRVGTYDIARVEVLKGPQGTLYGANALGGAVNQITNDPVLHRWEADASLELGSYSLISTQAAVNLPLTDNLAFRAASFTENRNGYLSNGLNDSVISSSRFKLLYQPNEQFRGVIGTEFSKVGGNGQGSSTWDPNDGPLASQPNPWLSTSPVGTAALSVFRLWGNFNYNFGPAVLTYVPAYTLERNILGLAFAANLPLFDYDQHEPLYSQELRLASPDSSPFKWTTGLYYLNLNSPVSFMGQTSGGSVTSKEMTTTYAAFAQVTYPLVSHIRLIGGLRYEEDQKREDTDAYASSADYAPQGTPTPGIGAANFFRATWKGGLEADVTPTTIAYATISSGFRSGGFLPATGATAINSYGPETLIAYELGTKGRLLDNRMTIDGDLFMYRYNDYQLSYSYPEGCEANACNTAIYAAPNAVSEGFELSGQYAASVADRIKAGATYLFTDVGQLSQASQVAFSNNSMDHAPRWAITAGYQHIFDLADRGSLTGSVDFRYQTKSFLVYNYEEPGYLPGALQPAFHQTALNALYEPLNARWSLSAYVKNLENYPVKTAFAPGSDPTEDSTSVSAPRTYGFVLSVKFGGPAS